MGSSSLGFVVKMMLNEVSGILVQRVTSAWGMETQRKKLERQLLAVQRKLADTGLENRTDQYVMRWIKDFRTVIYRADDILDCFQYEALRREADIKDRKTHKLLDQLISYNMLAFRFAVGVKLKDVLEDINELIEEMNKFNLTGNSVEAPEILSRQTHAAVEDTLIFGRDADKDSVVKLLLDQYDQHRVQVLAIIGMGGLGKTTLARMVYNDHTVQNHFQLIMWHCVADKFETIDLLKAIILLATNGTCKELPNTIELLGKQLREVIGKKRFLLVLDDVWNEHRKKWEEDTKPLLCSVGGSGCVILVTCRSPKVATIMATLKPHELASLGDYDSWELFSVKAFNGGVDKQESFVTIGRRIVSKCSGLPLALKTMGVLMSSKLRVQEWQAIEESNIGNDLCGNNDILLVLKLSYKHLSPEVRQCIAFCAVFPRGWVVEKDVLIQLWMANSFIQKEHAMDEVQKGEFIYHDLVQRSFIQEEPHSVFRIDEPIRCKIHELMHELVKDLTDECATLGELVELKATFKDVYHMTVFDAELGQISGSVKPTTPLRTLLAPSSSLMDLMELKLMSLRVLHCDAHIVHSKVLNDAKHLRYLELSGPGIVRLPDSICVLYNLQTLRLDGCYDLQELPESTRSLVKLVHLYLSRCYRLTRMPRNIGLLNNLHTLTKFIVGTEDGCGIEELKDLEHLGNMLQLFSLEKVKNVSNANEANLNQKQNLTELCLYWTGHRVEMCEDEISTEEQVLKSLTPHSKLKSLLIDGYGGQEIPRWMREPQMFMCLRRLSLINCERCRDIPVVWISLSLEYLELSHMLNLTTLCYNLDGEGQGHDCPLQVFPVLKEMFFSEVPRLETWAENSVAGPDGLVTFPMLEVLTINNCPRLMTVPHCPVLKRLRIHKCPSLSSNAFSHLTSLSYLAYDGESIEYLPLGSWPSLMNLHVISLEKRIAVISEDQQNLIPLENLRSLRLEGHNRFVLSPEHSLTHLGLWKSFVFLRELYIINCDELVIWPGKELDCLVNLRSLVIKHCSELVGSLFGLSSPKALLLPQLERFEISNCASLFDIPDLPASLQYLAIKLCNSLVALPRLANLANLIELTVNDCYALTALPDALYGFTSLEQLEIVNCPGIKKLSQTLIQRLPALKYLHTWGCPDLQRYCREGGEYFHSGPIISPTVTEANF